MMLLTDDTTTILPRKRRDNPLLKQGGGRIVTLLSSQFQPPYTKGCGTLCIHQHTLSMLLQQMGVEYVEKNISVSVVLIEGGDQGLQRGTTCHFHNTCYPYYNKYPPAKHQALIFLNFINYTPHIYYHIPIPLF